MSLLQQLYRKLHDALNGSVTRNPFADYTEPKISTEDLEEGWKKYTRKVAISVSTCVDNTAERIFILISFKKHQPNMDIFFQMNGRLMMWNDLDDPTYKQRLYDQVISQAPKLVGLVQKAYRRSHATPLTYTQIQYEFESVTIYSRDVTSKCVESQLDRTPAFLQWFDDVEEESRRLTLDSQKEMTWGPFQSHYK
ncbi:hypothetical protein [Staphylococcus pettenkoferi]|uniref:hypothetical protein n=1 Tax=Staphylococcus pettenkoferi TaxID=170573 RepID=UPI0011A39487|nr:hypothetical protein [Staphylococcus pettenkoferi]